MLSNGSISLSSETNPEDPSPKAPAESATFEQGLRCPRCQHVLRPGEWLCEECGNLVLKSDLLPQTDLLSGSAEITFKCPACALPCGLGLSVCPRCGRRFDAEDVTLEVDRRTVLAPFVHGALGAVSVDSDQPVMVEVDGQCLTLPIAPRVVLGRAGGTSDPFDRRPHVDLAAFNAAQKGVSRKHAEISRKYGLIYLTDLGSTNGTVLNGTVLMPHASRVIRSDDVVRLGQLDLHITLPPASPSF